MRRFLPPVEVAWSTLFEASPTSPPSPPKCDCKVQGYLESLGVTWQEADNDNQISPGVSVPLEEVIFVVRIPEVCHDVIMLNAAQVLLPPSRAYSGRASSKLSCEASEEDAETVRRVSGDEFREGFNLGDCVEAGVPVRDEFSELMRCTAEIMLLGELVDVVDENTFHFRHSHSGNTHVVTRDKLRSVSVPARSFDDCLYDPEGSFITMANIAVPNELYEWCSNPNLSGDFLCNKLWERAGTILATMNETGSQENGVSPPAYSISVYGTVESVEHAKVIITNQMKSLLDAATFQERRSRRLKLLEDRRSGQDCSERIEFFVHESLVGLVIGKQGENLARVARNYKVEVRVFPDENGVRRLRIYGSDPVKLDRAKAELDYHFLELPLPPKGADRFLEWLMSDKNILRDACNRHALHSLWYHSNRQSLIICGLRRSIADFIRTMDVSYRESHRSPSPTLKQTSFRGHTSPTTAAVSSTVGRNQLTRSQTPVLSPPLACPRPPILDALPSFQKSSQTLFKSGAKSSASSVLRDFPLSLAPLQNSNVSGSTSPGHRLHIKREQSETNLYSGDINSTSSRRVARTSPLIRPERGGTGGSDIMGPNDSVSRPNSSWWNVENRSEVGHRSLARYRRSPRMTSSCDSELPQGGWAPHTGGGQSSQPRFTSQQMLLNSIPPANEQSYYYCQPPQIGVYACPDVQQQVSPPTPQLYYNTMNPYEVQPSDYGQPRKFPPVGSRNGMSYNHQVPPDMRNMQGSMTTSGAYYWL